MFRNFLFVLLALIGIFQTGYGNSTAELQADFREKLAELILLNCKEKEAKGEYLDFSCENALSFFQDLEKNYLKKMNLLSKEYLHFYGLKGLMTAPQFLESEKKDLLTLIHLIEDCLQSILKLCDHYQNEELSIKVKEQINKFFSTIDEANLVELFLLLEFGKTERENILEKELIQDLFIEKTVKLEMVEDEEGDQTILECYKKIYEKSFDVALLDLFSKSTNGNLKDAFYWYHTIKSMDAKNFFLSLMRDYSASDSFKIEFFNIIKDHLEEVLECLDDLGERGRINY
jgi:hypothetical protein